jgi:protein-disulfide isomerase
VTVEQFTRTLMSAEPRISEQRIAEIFSENESALATLGEDEAKAKIRLDLESQIRLSALHAGLADLRAKASVKICLEEPVPPALEISDRGPSLGPSDAAVTIYEYSDFQCPYCRQARSVIEKILKSNEGKVRLVFKHLPLPIHPQAFAAATAAYCAHEQGRFWPFHDRLFDSNDLSVESLTRLATEVGLDMGRFAGCIGSEASRSEVLKDVQESRRAGFTGTPTFVINGRPLRGARWSPGVPAGDRSGIAETKGGTEEVIVRTSDVIGHLW